MRYRLIVWDFDGTLADTMALALTTYNALAARHGFRPLDDPAAVRGMGTRLFLKQHGISLFRLPFLLKEYLTATRSHMEKIRLSDGLSDLLRTLQVRGYRQGVLSSNSSENVRTCLRVNGVEDVFDFVVGYSRLFGKGRAIRKLLKTERLEPAKFLYVGDETRDVEGARQAGVDMAAVSWGFHTLEQLSQESPTYLWSSPSDVLTALS